MMCPLFVASDLSGQTGRVEISDHPIRRSTDGSLSGPSFGPGDEDTGSHIEGSRWKGYLDASRGDNRGLRPDHEAMASAVREVGLRRTLRSPLETTKSEKDSIKDGRTGVTAVSRTILRFPCEAFRGEAPERTRAGSELHVGENGIANGGIGSAAQPSRKAPEEAATPAIAGNAAAHRCQHPCLAGRGCPSGFDCGDGRRDQR